MRLIFITLLLSLTACFPIMPPAPTPSPESTLSPTATPAFAPRVIAYYPSWAGSTRGYYASNLPAPKLNVINYAFALPTENSECQLDNPSAAESSFPALRKLHSDHPGLEVLISIAGYGYDKQYKAIVENAESIQRFAASCVGFMQFHGFDGIDLDWEYPKPEQKAAYTALLAELRRQLDAAGQAAGRRYRLTIAAPAGYQLRAYDLPALAPLLDWIHVMTYDFYGSWSAVTGFNSPLYVPLDDPQKLSCDTAISAYLAAGVPPEKLILGIPFYGRAWTGVPPEKAGLFQPFRAVFSKGSFDYRELAETYIGKFERHWDELAQVPWLYDAESSVMITYDDPQSVALKAAYARRRGLGGIMIWQIAGDDRDSSLLNAVLSEFR